jgi:hypothetical protein
MRKLFKMSGTVLATTCLLFGSSPDRSGRQHSLPLKTRSEIMAKAQELAEHSWKCRDANTRATCLRAYVSDFHDDDTIVGVAYGWGEIDDVKAFDAKLLRGRGAGCHSRHGVNACTAGVDCSGLVALSWANMTSHYYTTRNLSEMASDLTLDRYKDLKPGDALVKSGTHVVLFVRYREDGNPTYYEASGRAGRVVLNDVSSWSDLNGFKPLRYKNLRDP